MGIYHFAGLGISPGAVTAGLSYIKKQYGNYHPQYGQMVEAVILFTSSAVAEGKLDIPPTAEYVYNEYGKLTERKKWLAKDTTELAKIEKHKPGSYLSAEQLLRRLKGLPEPLFQDIELRMF
ncbi:protein of unknown function [Candidatus Promineifilum breve]|uniref:Uncharacterized protein n=1 Tax=Candidatus Promineifilum breve TaxID=1806508 RepID=A0A160T6Z4_9CHLR|nr:hypothetical protein [Candidatus Promineifilum breve]CUS05068.2 protein of unknown function [Candidatus Promineifilum breve]